MSDKRLDPVEHVMQFFEYDHLPSSLQGISKSCALLALEMVATLDKNPELTVGLRKLLEAKDAFVRAEVAGRKSVTEKDLEDGQCPS